MPEYAIPEDPTSASSKHPLQTIPHWLWGGKIGPAFWTIASVLSMTVNIILIVVLILLGRQLFAIKALVQDQLLGGLANNFQQMDEAHIRTVIPVKADVPAKFDLPLNTQTMVTLTTDTTITGAAIYDLNAGALYISQASTTIVLPAGTQLPVQLNLTVPVDQTIPVDLLVNVDIPLRETELHAPFYGLQQVINPYYTFLNSLPNSWQTIDQGGGLLPTNVLPSQPNQP